MSHPVASMVAWSIGAVATTAAVRGPCAAVTTGVQCAAGVDIALRALEAVTTGPRYALTACVADDWVPVCAGGAFWTAAPEHAVSTAAQHDPQPRRKANDEAWFAFR